MTANSHVTRWMILLALYGTAALGHIALPTIIASASTESSRVDVMALKSTVHVAKLPITEVAHPF